MKWARRSSVDSSVSSILLPQIWIPSTQSTLLLRWKDENKPKKRPGLAHFLSTTNSTRKTILGWTSRPLLTADRTAARRRWRQHRTLKSGHVSESGSRAARRSIQFLHPRHFCRLLIRALKFRHPTHRRRPLEEQLQKMKKRLDRSVSLNSNGCDRFPCI